MELLLSPTDGYLYTHLMLQVVWVGTTRPSAFQVHAPVFEVRILRQRVAEYTVNIVPDGISGKWHDLNFVFHDFIRECWCTLTTAILSITTTVSLPCAW